MDTKIDYKKVWLLIPALSLTIFTIVIYLLMSPQEIEIFSNQILYRSRPISGELSTLIKLQILRMKLFEVAFIAQLVLTIFFGLKHLIKLKEKVVAFYSYILKRKLSNITMPLLFLWFSGIAAMISNIIAYNIVTDSPYILALPFIIHSTALLGILYGKHQGEYTLDNKNKTQLKAVLITQEENNTKLGSNYDELYVNMTRLLKKEQVFKDTDLRLNDLAMMLGSNRTYVSRLINHRTNSNFSDYINSYRIVYAKKLLSSQEEEQLTLDEVALESGFSSLSSFYRVFTKMENTSPAKYRAEQATMIQSSKVSSLKTS